VIPPCLPSEIEGQKWYLGRWQGPRTLTEHERREATRLAFQPIHDLTHKIWADLLNSIRCESPVARVYYQRERTE